LRAKGEKAKDICWRILSFAFLFRLIRRHSHSFDLQGEILIEMARKDFFMGLGKGFEFGNVCYIMAENSL